MARCVFGASAEALGLVKKVQDGKTGQQDLYASSYWSSPISVFHSKDSDI